MIPTSHQSRASHRFFFLLHPLNPISFHRSFKESMFCSGSPTPPFLFANDTHLHRRPLLASSPSPLPSGDDATEIANSIIEKIKKGVTIWDRISSGFGKSSCEKKKKHLLGFFRILKGQGLAFYFPFVQKR